MVIDGKSLVHALTGEVFIFALKNNKMYFIYTTSVYSCRISIEEMLKIVRFVQTCSLST